MMPTRTNLLVLKRLAIFFALWLVLTGAAPGGLIFGLAAASAAVWASTRLAPPDERRLHLLRLAALLPGFFLRALAGGIDVARRAFHPRLPLNPGWISYRARLPSGAPRALLGVEISLLPGSLVAGEKEGALLIHCLDTGRPVERQTADEEDRLLKAVEA